MQVICPTTQAEFFAQMGAAAMMLRQFVK